MEFDYKENQPALHEAAHAFAVWYFGGKIIIATIAGPSDENQPDHLRTFCYVTNEPPEVKNQDRLTYDDYLFRIMVSLAPHAVEKKFIGAASIATLMDIQKAMRFLSPAYEDPVIRSLVEGVREIIDKNSSWENATLEFYQIYGKPVKDFFDQEKVESAIKALAQFIAKKGRLTGFEIVHFLESIWDKPLPKAAKRASEHSTGFRGGTLANTLASTNRLVELIHHNLNDCVPENAEEEQILEKAFQYVLESLFKIKELESMSK